MNDTEKRKEVTKGKELGIEGKKNCKKEKFLLHSSPRPPNAR